MKKKISRYKGKYANYPSVTEILSFINKNDALLYWANNLGFKRIKLDDEQKKHEDIGTLTHKRIENYLLGKNPNIPCNNYNSLIVYQSDICFRNFMDWYNEQDKVEIILSEKSYTSKKYKYNGTLDFYGLINGNYYLVDFKTSKQFTLKYIIQLAAYRNLIKENEKNLECEKAMILRLDKLERKNEEEIINKKELDYYLKYFLLLKKLYTVYNKNEYTYE